MKKITLVAFLSIGLSCSAFAFKCPGYVTCNGNTLNTCVISDPNFQFFPGLLPTTPVNPGTHNFIMAYGSVPASSIAPTGCSYENNEEMASIALAPINPKAIPNIYSDSNKNWYPDGLSSTSYRCVKSASECQLAVSYKK